MWGEWGLGCFMGVLCSTWSRFCSGLILALARTLTQMSMAIILGLQLDVQSDGFLTLISYEVYVCFFFFFFSCLFPPAFYRSAMWRGITGRPGMVFSFLYLFSFLPKVP